MQLQWLDVVIIGIIGLSALTGLFRGAVKEIIALCIWVLAIWLGYKYAQAVAPWLEPYIQDETARSTVAFLAILFGVLFTGALINMVLGFILRHSGLGGMDKILGMGFGVARGIFIVSLIMATVKMTSLPYQEYTQDSKVCQELQPVVEWIAGYVPLFLDKVKAVDKTGEMDIGSLIDTIPQT